MQILPTPLLSLENVNQFIVWKLTPSHPKNIKQPIDYKTGAVANALDTNIHTDFKTASIAVQIFGQAYGIGFVLTKNDPYFLLDIDECLLDNNEWSKTATSLLSQFFGAAVEISSSYRGLHVLGKTEKIPHACKYKPLNLELYTHSRFIALTGTNIVGNINSDHTPAFKDLVKNYFSIPVGIQNFSWTEEPTQEWDGPTSDEDLIVRALNSKTARQIFSGYSGFKALWENDVESLSKAFPDSTGTSSYDESSADLALANHLAFWTGKNCQRIKELMFKSGLVRDKWNREKYIDNTILRACSSVQNVLVDKKTQALSSLAPPNSNSIQIDCPPKSIIVAPQFTLVTGNTFLTPQQQMDLFKDCVYIEDQDSILVPGGKVLDHGQFKRRYGGYTLLMDNRNERIKRDAFEAFTESQAFRSQRADTTCFRPDLAPASIVWESGESQANLWWPPEIRRKKGDPTPFLRHLDSILPHEVDRQILLGFICACVQYVGKKFTWCVMLQGVEGNGKSLIGECLAEAIGGPRRKFIATPRPNKLTGQFNNWQFGNVLALVNEIYFPSMGFENIENLKTIITDEWQAIEPKGIDQTFKRTCCNLFLTSNYTDAIQKTKNDRRYAPFYTAQQEKEDLFKNGFQDKVFELQVWLKNKDGYAIVSEFMYNYDIPKEFNPLYVRDAPVTTSTERAINESRSTVEQEILEAVAQGLIGFRGDWISSHYLDQLLKSMNLATKISYNKRRDLLKSLGYIYHPCLPDGRATTVVMPDGIKPRLFITRGHKTRNYESSVEVCRQYTLDQNLS